MLSILEFLAVLGSIAWVVFLLPKIHYKANSLDPMNDRIAFVHKKWIALEHECKRAADGLHKFDRDFATEIAVLERKKSYGFERLSHLRTMERHKIGGAPDASKNTDRPRVVNGQVDSKMVEIFRSLVLPHMLAIEKVKADERWVLETIASGVERSHIEDMHANARRQADAARALATKLQNQIINMMQEFDRMPLQGQYQVMFSRPVKRPQ